MSDSEGDDYIYVGTALRAEAAPPVYAAPSAAKGPSQVIGLPVHQQQVRDAQGRQRLHGAFTGGFSAGYFNSVDTQVRLCSPTMP
jgi:G patch domain-containing protein 1